MCTFDLPMAVYSVPYYGEVTYAFVPTPEERTIVIPAEDRTYTIPECEE